MLKSLDVLSDSILLPPSQTAMEVVAAVVDLIVEDAVVAVVVAVVARAEAVVDSVTEGDVVELVVAEVEAQIVEDLATSRAQRRLSKSACLRTACLSTLPHILCVDSWVVGFVGCGLLTILLPRSCGL